jgi:XRE family transcriptional regulator, fatty acid utilization regulator
LNGGSTLAQSLIGNRIRARRETLNMKQAHLARDVGISASYLNLIEHNRRGIAGKILLDIASRLDVGIASLQQGAQTSLVQAMQKAAANTDSKVEVNRIEEMVGRFPGWSNLVAELQAKAARLERNVEGLSDRLTYDPYLAESLHEMLSNVTAIRSTAAILHDMPDIEPAQQARFHTNMHNESRRLSDISQALVTYFDQMAGGEIAPSTPLDEFETFLAEREYSLAELEPEVVSEAAITDIVNTAPALTSEAAKASASVFLQQLRQEAGLLPRKEFINAGRQLDFAPDMLASQFGTDMAIIFRRLAFLPRQEDVPQFGMVSCDISGAVTLRKPLPGFALPRYGAACPLWPLYQSIAQPGLALEFTLEMPDGGLFKAYAYCQRLAVTGFNQPQILQANMLLREVEPQDNSAIPVGPSCRICPRQNCQARREPTILATREASEL